MLPDTSALGISRESPRYAERMPLLMSISFGGFALHGLWTISLLCMALLNIGTYTENGESITGWQFLSSFGAVFFPNGILSLVIALAMWKEKPWSRELVLFAWVLYAVVISVGGMAVSGPESFKLGPSFNAAIGIATSWWYFYKKKSVSTYFGRIDSNLANGG